MDVETDMFSQRNVFQYRVCEMEEDNLKQLETLISKYGDFGSLTVEQIMHVFKMGLNYNQLAMKKRALNKRYQKKLHQLTVEQRERGLVHRREWYYKNKRKQSESVIASSSASCPINS